WTKDGRPRASRASACVQRKGMADVWQIRGAVQTILYVGFSYARSNSPDQWQALGITNSGSVPARWSSRARRYRVPRCFTELEGRQPWGGARLDMTMS